MSDEVVTVYEVWSKDWWKRYATMEEGEPIWMPVEIITVEEAKRRYGR